MKKWEPWHQYGAPNPETYNSQMIMKKLLLRFKDESLYIWLKKHSEKIGESMTAIVRRALREYKERL